MDEVRKNAYRNLLYRGMVDIRNSADHRAKASLNPLTWYRRYRAHRVAGEIADWLHNLAYYAARDFKGFKEERFWQEYEDSVKRFPGSGLESYRKSFDRFLDDPAILW